MSATRRAPSRRAFVRSAPLMAGAAGAPFAPAAAARGGNNPLWDFFELTLRRARYIDLTHALAPGGPLGEGFVDFKVGPARAGIDIPGLIRRGQPFSYAGQ